MFCNNLSAWNLSISEGKKPASVQTNLLRVTEQRPTKSFRISQTDPGEEYSRYFTIPIRLSWDVRKLPKKLYMYIKKLLVTGAHTIVSYIQSTFQITHGIEVCCDWWPTNQFSFQHLKGYWRTSVLSQHARGTKVRSSDSIARVLYVFQQNFVY